jgi:AraC-like DNA-binding protein
MSLAKAIEDEKVIVIDGYIGIFFDDFIKQLENEFARIGEKVAWLSVEHQRSHFSAILIKIAFESGFGNCKNISQKFKQVKGCTPIGYRKKHLTGK